MVRLKVRLRGDLSSSSPGGLPQPLVVRVPPNHNHSLWGKLCSSDRGRPAYRPIKNELSTIVCRSELNVECVSGQFEIHFSIHYTAASGLALVLL